MARDVTIPEKITKEEIQSFQLVIGSHVTVVIGVGSDDAQGVFSFDPDQQFETLTISGDDYQALMSENPPWAPTKPGNTFRKDDLWFAIDAIRSNTALDTGVIISSPQ